MPSFAALTDEFLDTEFAESPVRASSLGLTEYDDRLDDLSEAAFERRRAADAGWLERFRAVARCRARVRRADRPRPGHQHPARPSDRRGLRGLAPAAGHLPQPRHERHLRPLPAPIAADRGAGRLGGRADAPDPGQSHRWHAQPAAGHGAVDLPGPRRQPGARRGALSPRDPARPGGGRGICAPGSPRRARRPARPTTATSPSSRRCDPARPATGGSARSATRRSCARRSCSDSARASCATAARPHTTSSPPS